MCENYADVPEHIWQEAHRLCDGGKGMKFTQALAAARAKDNRNGFTQIKTAEAVPVGVGEAVKLCGSIEAFLAMHRKGVLTPRTPNIPIELLEKALVVLRSQRDDAAKASETAREEAFDEALKFIASRAHAALAARSASTQGGE